MRVARAAHARRVGRERLEEALLEPAPGACGARAGGALWRGRPLGGARRGGVLLEVQHEVLGVRHAHLEAQRRAAHVLDGEAADAGRVDVDVAKVDKVGAARGEDAVEERVEAYPLQVHIPGAHLEDLVVGPVQQVGHGDLLPVRLVHPAREEVDLELHCLLCRDGHLVGEHAEHLAHEAHGDQGAEVRVVRHGNVRRLACADAGGAEVDHLGLHRDERRAGACVAHERAPLPPAPRVGAA